jgi:hypothetical protein
VSTEPELPVELATALAESEDAQQNWAAADLDLQRLYIAFVRAPRRRRVREERAADTVLTARLGTLREHAHDKSLSWWDVFGDFLLPF